MPAEPALTYLALHWFRLLETLCCTVSLELLDRGVLIVHIDVHQVHPGYRTSGGRLGTGPRHADGRSPFAFHKSTCLCLTMSPSLWKYLPHTRQCTCHCDTSWCGCIWLHCSSLWVVGFAPAHPGEGFLVPLLFLDSHSIQILSDHVSPPFSRPSGGWGEYEVAEQDLLWTAVVRHSGHVAESLQTALGNLCCYTFHISPLLPCHLISDV